MSIYLEIFGYIGSALVLLSMMMTSVKWLRIVNMTGAVISAIYGALMRTWPVAALNIGIIIIHIIKLCRLHAAQSTGGQQHDTTY